MTQPFQIRNIFKSSPTPPSHPSVPPSRHSSSLTFPFRALKWLLIGSSPKIRLSTDELETKRRRLAVSVGTILLIVLVLSAIFGYYRRQELVRKNRLSTWRSRADWIISQADQLSQVSPSRAGELVREERLSLEAELEKSQHQKLTSSLETLISALAESERRVSRVETVTPQLYLSLGLIRPATSGRRLVHSSNQLAILSADSVVLLVSMSGRSGEVIAGGDLIKQGIDLAVSVGNTFVLNPENIVEIDNQKKTSAVAVTDEDDAWQDPFRLSIFSGNIYLLDRGKSEIYRFSQTDPPLPAEALAKAGRRWLAPGIAPNLSGVIDMAIDGDIWLLHQDGRLDRYRRGAPAGFKLSGLPNDLISPQAISVPQDGSRVFLLDNSSRVVAFDKNSGDYAGMWQFSGLEVSSLAVSESLAKIFLLAGENIYVIGIK